MYIEPRSNSRSNDSSSNNNSIMLVPSNLCTTKYSSTAAWRNLANLTNL